MLIFIVIIVTIIVVAIVKKINELKYIELESEVLHKLGFASWDVVPKYDAYVVVKSRQSLENYEGAKFFKEHSEKLKSAKKIIKNKKEITDVLNDFLNHNEYITHSQYNRLVERINEAKEDASGYRICVNYTSSTGRVNVYRTIILSQNDITRFEKNPELLMGKGEYNRYLKEKQQEALSQKHHEYYERVNAVIDYANENREKFVIKGAVEQLDGLIAQLFDRTVNSIKKIKTIDSEEWDVIGNFINRVEYDINEIVKKNKKILEYYDSPEFIMIKETCEVLMSTQREFNEYITEKLESISKLLGTKISRNETINEDEYQYIRLYKKTITPFTAEVSAAVFASAENKPLEYVVKHFYPNKEMYPEQIQKLHLLVEELATLKDAKQIIENYKLEYQQYLGGVPDYIIKEDEAGFYTRLGFATIDESILKVEYKFSYTSGGGMAKRTFTIPMTEDNIVQLIKMIEGKLTMSSFTREQRSLMTNKLRESIKRRDNYTCCNCRNSIYREPNLLLEIDHIIPVSKGGYTLENNLQTLCWKCNRAKSNRIE